MRSVRRTPSLVPQYDVAVHIVLDDFGQAGRVYRETDEAKADLEELITDLLSGQYNNPVRVVAFNTAEGWSRDVSEDVAWELIRRVIEHQSRLNKTIRKFVEFHIGENELLRAEAGFF